MEENEGGSYNTKITPPTDRKVRNPFDRPLIEKMHKPICSPGMCKVYKRRASGVFRWDIEQACTLKPADIVACNSQYDPSPDHGLERIAEEAAEKFFSQDMVMPSPLESSKKIRPPLQVSKDDSSCFKSFLKQETIIMRDVSAQTILTLPPVLPSDIEKILQPFCTFTQDQNLDSDYETANVSLRRKLFFEEHSEMEHYDSEHTDDEIHPEQRPPSGLEAHTPVIFSPDCPSRDLVANGMIRTFGTPLQKRIPPNSKGYRNKILNVADLGEPCFSPIGCHTPKRLEHISTTSSLASVSISPVTKTSSDEEKNNFTSPESEPMLGCHNCVTSSQDTKEKGDCFCDTPPNKSILIKRSASLKESPPRSRKCSLSLSEKRSLSMSSLNRSRSVQKLDFSMDMSIDTSLHDQSRADSVPSPSDSKKVAWSILDETSIQNLVTAKTERQQAREIQSSTKLDNINMLDETPIKGRSKIFVRSREIAKMRAQDLSPLHMSLDNSLDNSDNALNLEDKKIDFDKVDLKFLTENTQIDNTLIKSKHYSTSFKRIDSGFNENTFYASPSSYYESAIKPSELTVTAMSKDNNSKAVLKEVSNTNWMRVDSGFKDENSADSIQFYASNENFVKKGMVYPFSEGKLEGKENMVSGDLDRYLVQTNKNEGLSMSDSLFTEDMTFNCNFSSTPSKNKSRKTFS